MYNKENAGKYLISNRMSVVLINVCQQVVRQIIKDNSSHKIFDGATYDCELIFNYNNLPFLCRTQRNR